MKRISLLGLVCVGGLALVCDHAAWASMDRKLVKITGVPKTASTDKPKMAVLTPTDLINRIMRADAKEDRDIDFMFTIYKKFAEANPKSIAGRVYDKVGKGKREANYKPKTVDIEECLPALEQLSQPDYHEDDEKPYIIQMAQKFEEFELKSSL